MRLIDADKLKKDVLNLQDCYNGFSDTYDKACIIGVIDEQPTIEPERKKGKWLHKSKQLAVLNTAWWYECSICGYHAFNGMRTDFCPNCGAEMRGEKHG